MGRIIGSVSLSKKDCLKRALFRYSFFDKDVLPMILPMLLLALARMLTVMPLSPLSIGGGNGIKNSAVS
jgi:hypothetical protein